MIILLNGDAHNRDSHNGFKFKKKFIYACMDNFISAEVFEGKRLEFYLTIKLQKCNFTYASSNARFLEAISWDIVQAISSYSQFEIYDFDASIKQGKFELQEEESRKHTGQCVASAL